MNSMELTNFVRTARTAVASKPREYTVDKQIAGMYPHWDDDTSECKPASVEVFSMVEPTGKKGHNVVLAYLGPDNYSIWCGDNFLELGTTKMPPEDRIAMAVAEMPSVDNATATALLGELRGTVDKSTACGFWRDFKNKGTLCKHCNQLLVLKESELPSIKRSLQERFESVMNNAPMATSELVLPENAFAKMVMKTPILLEGEKGWGKTREARVLAEALNARLVEVQGHESVEAADLTGYTVRHGHDMVWKDGRLSQAFRLAAKGEKIVLLLDELLRIPQRQLSVLLSALSPYKGNYYLATGRIVDVVDGIGSEETIVCPVENLYVVGTTNVGAQYAVDAMDPALQERFLLIRKAIDVAILKSAVLEKATEKGFTPSVADKCVEFFKAMAALRPNSLVADVPNPRTMVRAVHLSDTEADMKASVMAQALTWVGRDVEGNPIPEQEEAVIKAINKVWR
jgi:MoxR-like ATPase